jgi:hypothetical protein
MAYRYAQNWSGPSAAFGPVHRPAWAATRPTRGSVNKDEVRGRVEPISLQSSSRSGSSSAASFIFFLRNTSERHTLEQRPA